MCCDKRVRAIQAAMARHGWAAIAKAATTRVLDVNMSEKKGLVSFKCHDYYYLYFEALILFRVPPGAKRNYRTNK